MPPMPAADAPDAGHATVPSGPWRDVTGVGWDVTGPERDLFTSTTAMPPAQIRTASIARITRRA
jgi:hypothetical protein